MTLTLTPSPPPRSLPLSYVFTPLYMCMELTTSKGRR